MITTRTVGGVALILLGGLFLLDQAGRLDAGEVLRHWWPLILIGVGVALLIETRRLGPGPLILIGVGTLLELGALNIIRRDVWRFAWPVLLIAGGFLVILRPRGERRRHRRGRGDLDAATATSAEMPREP